MSLFKKKTPLPIPYDPEALEPAVRSSICTGELTLGFLERRTGRFHEYALAHSQSDVDAFCHRTGTASEKIKRVY